MLKNKAVLTAWAPQAIIITILCGLLYISIQQILRQSANDPQIQMAEDYAAGVSAGNISDSLSPAGTIDISRSLAPFIIIYDSAGKPLTGNAILDNKIPAVPFEVLRNAKDNGQNRITWQPEKGLKIAAVIIPFFGKTKSGFVLAGRSLREVQIRTSKIDIFCVSTWLILLAASYLIHYIIKTYAKENVLYKI
jgi:hypothetical protein